MKNFQLKLLVSEEIKRFMEWFALNEIELKQTTTIMPDELTSVVDAIKKRSKYTDMQQVKSGNTITFTLNGDEVMRYDLKKFTLHHNFLPSTIVDTI